MNLEALGLRTITARELIAALLRDGFVFDRAAGSHQVFCHPDGRRVTVSPHGSGATFHPKTLSTIIVQQARWSENDLVRLGLATKKRLKKTS